MFCKNCGNAMNSNQAICLKCGVKVGQGSAFCANCGKPTPAQAAVCLNCGVATKKSSVMSGELGGQDKITMALICFFLGGFGVHNFMMGETKKGIAKLVMAFCFGISGIFALIDLIMILTDKYEVNPEKII